MNYYIADTHFGHKNVLLHDQRPFQNVDEMNAALIQNWNETVTDSDDIWVLGDFCYCSRNTPDFYLKQLNGRKHLIIGNHDRSILQSSTASEYFVTIEHLRYLKDGTSNVILCHFPMADWSGKYRGFYHIYGHIHNACNEVSEFMSRQERTFNAGCMLHNYKPVTLAELMSSVTHE